MNERPKNLVSNSQEYPISLYTSSNSQIFFSKQMNTIYTSTSIPSSILHPHHHTYAFRKENVVRSFLEVIFGLCFDIFL